MGRTLFYDFSIFWSIVWFKFPVYSYFHTNKANHTCEYNGTHDIMSIIMIWYLFIVHVDLDTQKYTRSR